MAKAASGPASAQASGSSVNKPKPKCCIGSRCNKYIISSFPCLTNPKRMYINSHSLCPSCTTKMTGKLCADVPCVDCSDWDALKCHSYGAIVDDLAAKRLRRQQRRASGVDSECSGSSTGGQDATPSELSCVSTARFGATTGLDSANGTPKQKAKSDFLVEQQSLQETHIDKHTTVKSGALKFVKSKSSKQTKKAKLVQSKIDVNSEGALFNALPGDMSNVDIIVESADAPQNVNNVHVQQHAAVNDIPLPPNPEAQPFVPQELADEDDVTTDPAQHQDEGRDGNEDRNVTIGEGVLSQILETLAKVQAAQEATERKLNDSMKRSPSVTKKWTISERQTE